MLIVVSVEGYVFAFGGARPPVEIGGRIISDMALTYQCSVFVDPSHRQEARGPTRWSDV